jgi:hypothetical protein
VKKIKNLINCQSQSYFTTDGLPPFSSSWRHSSWDSRPAIFFYLNTCFHSSYVISSLTRGRVCSLLLLLALASAVILRINSRGRARSSYIYIYISNRNRVAHDYPHALGSLFIACYDSQGYGIGIRHRLHTKVNKYWILENFYVVAWGTPKMTLCKYTISHERNRTARRLIRVQQCIVTAWS